MENWKRYLRTGAITLILGIPLSFTAYSYADTQDRVIQMVQRVSAARIRGEELMAQAEKEWYDCDTGVRCPPEEGCFIYGYCADQYEQKIGDISRRTNHTIDSTIFTLYCRHSLRNSGSLAVSLFTEIPTIEEMMRLESVLGVTSLSTLGWRRCP